MAGRQEDLERNTCDTDNETLDTTASSTPTTTSPGNGMDASYQARLSEILSRPENTHCADCNAEMPKWASVSLGCFICTQCAGVHRSLGVHISFVLSCTLDKWTAEQIDKVDQVGNAEVNRLLESNLPSQAMKPDERSTRDQRESFIVDKYQHRYFQTGSPQHAQSFAKSPQSPFSMRRSSSPNRRKSSSATAKSHGMVEYVGIVVIDLIEAANLVPVGVSDKSSPYVRLSLGEQSISSPHVHKDANPRWANQKLMLSWDGKSPLLIEVLDRHKLRSDRLMGTGVVTTAMLQELPSQVSSDDPTGDTARDEWIPLQMPKEWASNFSEHLMAGAEGVGRGFYKGIKGVWKEPVNGAKANGIGGLAKGMGAGMVGVVSRPVRGFGSMVRHSAMSVGAGKKRGSENEPEMVDTGAVHMKLSMQRF